MPRDATASRRAEQSSADERMASYVEGGMSDPRGASVEGRVPLASTTRSLAARREDWEEHKRGIAARDQPLEHDPFGQAIVSMGFSSALGAAITGIAAVAEEAVGHTLAHAAFDFAEHQLHEIGVEGAERARDKQTEPSKLPVNSTPKPVEHGGSCEPPLQTPSMYRTWIPG